MASRKMHPRLWQPTFLLNRALIRSIRTFAAAAATPGTRLSLLDVGCGSMPYRDEFPPDRFNYLGCDLYSADEAVVKCPAGDLSFPADSFDVVVCFQVLEHVPEPKRVCDEILRVLKPGGRAYISTPFIYPHHGSPRDYYRYSHEGIVHLAGESGGSDFRIEGHCLFLQSMVLFLIIQTYNITGKANRVPGVRALRPILLGATNFVANLVGLLGGTHTSTFRGSFPIYSNVAITFGKKV